MARLSKEHVHAALEKAAQNILDASGDDPFVSRQDIRLKLQQLSGVEQQLTSIFYRFMDHRDHKPGARITESDVLDTLAYAKEKLVDAYDRNNNGLSKTEIEKMSLTGKLAVRFAKILKERNQDENLESTPVILKQLEALGDGLFFPAWANESDAFLNVFYKEANLTTLNPENFAATLGLDPTDPAQEVFIFQQGVEELWWIFENYQDYEEESYPEQFSALLDFMVTHLKDITHIIVGRDGYSADSQYPVYLVGLAPAGDIVGFETYTVWT
ncbi:MAG: nuclease A inhibitor family protein [Saprospiraceae bacterium]